MERISSSVGGSRSYNDDDHAIAEENLQFGMEFQRLVTANPLSPAPASSKTGNSFTALLGLPANQAMELLHEPEPGESPASPDNEIRRDDQRRCERKVIHSFSCTPTFPSNKDLVERAARYSIFAAAASAAATEDSPESSYVPSNSTGNSPKRKSEPTDDSESSPSSSNLAVSKVKKKSAKRKQREKMVKAFGKRTKDVEKHGDQSKDGEKLPYVHVRARRGQATDSHSLAERARREKINARMRLLQELVPGCSKISGTALVLDEIINHVQALQCQVELLSMRLAAVNPRIDFNLDSLMPSEDGCSMVGVGTFPSLFEPSMWPDIQGRNTSGGSQLYPNQNSQQQFWHLDVLPPPIGERDENQNFITSPEESVFSYKSSSNSENIHVNQLKMEI